MKKVKLLVSIGVAMALSIAIIYKVSEIEETNKAEIAKTISEERDLNEVANEKEKVDIKGDEKLNIEDKSKIANIENNGTSSNTSGDKKEVVSETAKSTEVDESKAQEGNQEQNKEVQVYSFNQNDAVKAPQKVEENVEEKVESSNQNESSSYIAEIEQAIFARVNVERSASGLAPLSYNNTMQTYSRIKSKDMGDRGYFDHANPEGELITAQMQRDGVTYNAWGENIAYIQGNSNNASLADQFMTNWMNSQGHRENILSGNFTSMGVGVYKIGNTYYATQEFYR